MAIADSLLNIGANAMAAAVTYVALVDAGGAEPTGGGYSRQPVAWTAAAAGRTPLAGDETFSIPAGFTVAGWRGFTAASGGTNHGGADLPAEPFPNGGEYVLLAVNTAIDLNPA